MSVTTAIPVIRKTSGITEEQVTRLYDRDNTPQPTNQHYMNGSTVWSHVDRSSSIITIEEVRNNLSYAAIVEDAMERDDDVQEYVIVSNNHIHFTIKRTRVV